MAALACKGTVDLLGSSACEPKLQGLCEGYELRQGRNLLSHDAL